MRWKWLGYVVGGAAGLVAAPFIAPAIGAIASAAGLGAAAGTLSGAAASSAGLAALGGGSLAAGGFGAAGGAAVVTATSVAVGGTAGYKLGEKADSGKRGSVSPVGKFVDSFVDNVLREKVSRLRVGSVLWCDVHAVEHSGIYIGNKLIAHLNGDGRIEAVSPYEFMNRLGGFNTAMSVYVACSGGKAVGSKTVAENARGLLGWNRDYKFYWDNCHRFTAYCLTGDYSQKTITFMQLQDLTWDVLNANCWRVWDA